MATSERLHAGVHAVVRYAIRRGWLTGEQLREALLLQEQLRAAGRPTELLPILRARYLRPELVAELTQVYRDAVGPLPHTGDTLAMPARELPQELLRRSSELLRRPRAEDPPRVREFLRASGEGADLEPTAPERPPARARIGGYEVRRELARGGMGVVYEARSLSLDRPVALKVMRDALAPEPEDVERFLLEARAAARLRHPGIVGVHEVGQDDGRWFIAMDLVEGESLKQRLQRDGPLPPREAARITLGVARALAYAHERAILHRDVKPANVLLSREGEPLLTDFGLAKDIAREDRGLTATGAAVGTPAYMPPEQATGDAARLDRRADVYGLGATLFEALVGRAPFRGATALAVLEAVVKEAPPRPSALRPEVDADLETICLTCLEKEPERRYVDASALAADLEAWLEHRPIRARPVGPLGRLARWARRRPVAAGAVICVALAALVTGVGLWAWRAGLERARHDERARQRAAVEDALAAVEGGAPARALLDATTRAPAEVVREVAGERLVALAGDLRAVAAAIYLEAEPDEAERAAGAAPVPGLRAAVDAWAAAAPGERLGDAHEAALREAEARLTRRAARGADRRTPSFCELAGARQVAAAGARLLVADAACEALVRAGDPAATPALERYLDALFEPERTIAPARALCALGGARGQDAVLRALRRLGERSPFAGPLKRALEQVRADVRLAGGAARDHVEQARARLDKDDDAGAIEAATRALELDPTLGEAWTLRARARLGARDEEGALVDARRAVELQPDVEEAWLALGNALRARHEPQAALEAFDRAVALAPDSGWARRARSLARLSRDPAGALEDADHAVALAPGDPRVHVGRAIVRERLNDLTGALDDLAAALAVDPEHATALSMRGAVRLRMGRAEEAFADLTRALELAPAERSVAPAALANRALLKRDRGDLEGALRDVEAALRIDPEAGRAYLVRAGLRAARDDLEGALADLDRAVEHDPEDAEVLANRGSVRAATGDAAGALADLDRAVDLEPRSLVARLQRGKVRAERGELQGARVDLEQATRLDDRSPEAWRLLAEVHGRLGDATAEARCREQALALDPDPAGAAFRRAQQRVDERDWPGAERFLDTALAARDEARSRLLRGKVRLVRRRPAEAREDFDAAVRLDPSDWEGWVGRSLARLESGDAEAADADLEAAARACPEPVALWEARAEWRLELGDASGALADADRALAMTGERPRPRSLLVRGAALQLIGRLTDAVQAYERFLALSPDAPEARQVREVVRDLRAASPER